MEKISYLGTELCRWQVGKSTFLALPEHGARLMNWNVELADGTVRDVVYWPEIQSLDNLPKVRGGNPVLFPFSGRSFDRGEIGFWRTPDDRRLPMPMHGFARQGKFQLERSGPGGFTALFLPSDECKNSYPYDYEFRVSYRFSELGFFVEFSLKNTGRLPLPWSAGHHFYFTLPWSEGLKRSDYSLRLPSAQRLRQDQHGKLIDMAPPEHETLISDEILQDSQHVALAESTVIVREKPTGSELVIKFDARKTPPPYRSVVTWTETASSPFFCVEPWMGPPNAPEHKRGLSIVEPGHSESFVVEVSIR